MRGGYMGVTSADSSETTGARTPADALGATKRMSQKDLGEFRPAATCPTCGEMFDSEHGVQNHHRVHDRPYFDADVERRYGVPTEWLLSNLYTTLRQSTREIAEMLGYSKPTVVKHLKRHGIPLRESNRKRPVHFGTYSNTTGFAYEVWQHNLAEGRERVYVHRLLAVAKYGFDAVCDMDVHHRNEVPWDNRHGNIGLMDHSEHRAHHSRNTND